MPDQYRTHDTLLSLGTEVLPSITIDMSKRMETGFAEKEFRSTDDLLWILRCSIVHVATFDRLVFAKLRCPLVRQMSWFHSGFRKWNEVKGTNPKCIQSREKILERLIYRNSVICLEIRQRLLYRNHPEIELANLKKDINAFNNITDLVTLNLGATIEKFLKSTLGIDIDLPPRPTDDDKD